MHCDVANCGFSLVSKGGAVEFHFFCPMAVGLLCKHISGLLCLWWWCYVTDLAPSSDTARFSVRKPLR